MQKILAGMQRICTRAAQRHARLGAGIVQEDRRAMTTQIVIAEGSSLAALGAETVLQQRPETVLHRAENADELIALVRRLQPEVIVLGEGFDPLHDTRTLAERVLGEAPRTRVIMLGDTLSGTALRTLFMQGVRGYLARADELSGCLRRAVDAVLRHRLYLSPTAHAEHLLALQGGYRGWLPDAEARTILLLLAEGLTAGEIATRLSVSRRHIYWVTEKLRARLGASTNAHLISRAVSEGYIPARA